MTQSAPTHVLMLLENNPYPHDPRVRQEARALVSAGYRVSVICPAVPHQPWRESIDGVRVYRFPAPPPVQGVIGYLWEYGFSMLAIFTISLLVLIRNGFDVVHTHNPPDTLVIIAACYKALGKRFVYDHHDLAPELYLARFGGPGNPAIYRTLLWLERLSCQLADLVIATNQSYRRIEMQRDGVPNQRIAVVRNGPDLDRLQPAMLEPGRTSHGKTVIGYAGSMGFHDGVDYLLRALWHLIYDLGRTDVECLLVGSGDAWPSLEALIDQLGLAAYVRWSGWVDHQQVARYLNDAAICVAPEPSNAYNDHSTMIKLMEYMALAKPIVAFDLPEHRFTAQEAALYVPPNDEHAFAHALAQLIDDPARREAMGAFGRRRIETGLSWQHASTILLNAYRAMLAPAKGHAKVKAADGHAGGFSQDMPLVSIIITCYNHASYIAESIESALNQTYLHIEVVVVDDGSTDGSSEIIARYGDRIVPVFKENGGQASAVNAGFAASHGEIICLLDSDDIFFPTKVARVIDAWREHPDAPLVYHQLQMVDAENKNRLGAPWPRAVWREDIRSRVSRSGGWWPRPTTSGVCFTRAYLDRIFPIPTGPRRIWPDTYLTGPAPFVGPVVGIDQPLALFRLHKNNNWTVGRVNQQYEKGDLIQRKLDQYAGEFQVLKTTLLDRLGIVPHLSLQDHLRYQQYRRAAGEPVSLLRVVAIALMCPTLPVSLKWREAAKIVLNKW